MPEDFFARWGRVSGKPKPRYKPNPQRAAARRAPAAVRNRAARARQGGPNIPAAAHRASKNSYGSSGFSSSPERQTAGFNSLVDQLTTDYMASAQKQDVITRTLAYQTGQEPGPEGILGQAQNVGSGILGGIMSSPVGTILHEIGRPANSLFQGMEDTAAMRDADNGSILGTFFGGAKRGFFYEGDPGATGPDNASGFGQVYEALKDNPDSPLHRPLSALEEAHPAWEQALAISAGAAGEMLFDPTNLIAPALPNIMRGGGAVTKEAFTETLEAASRASLDNALSATPGLFSRSPFSPDMIHARAGEAMSDALNDSILRVMGGGTPHTSTLGGAAMPSLVSQRWGQSVIDSIGGPAEEALTRLKTNARTITSHEVEALRASSKDFDEVWTALTAEMKNQGFPITGGPVRIGGKIVDTSIIEVLAVMRGQGGDFVKFIDSTWDNLRNAHFVELQPHIDELYKAVENPTTRTLGIRLGHGRHSRVVNVPVIGRAYAWVGDRLGAIPGMQGLGSALYERRFPALFAGRISRASAYGVKGMDNFMRDLERMAKGNLASGVVKAFTPAEGEELFKAMGDAAFKFGDTRMDEALDSLRAMRDERFYEELREGARSIDREDGSLIKGNQHDPNYQYIHLKGGTKTAREAFQEGRKKAYEKFGHSGQYTVEYAKKEGLKPIDNAFEAMQLHYMDSANNITRAYFWQDLASNYGLINNATVTGINDLERQARNLKAVEYGKLSEALKQMVKDTGGKFYIPREMHKIGKDFDSMMKWSTASMGQFGRSFSSVINKFKIWTTIPYPGFHTRNFMGDTMMGMLDGVSPTRYTEVMTKYLKSRKGLANNFHIIPGVDMNFKELIALFREEANSGYLRMDIGLTSTKTVGKIGGIGRKVGAIAKEASDDRELLPRLTHYLHALRDESKALWKSGLRDTDEILTRARDAALWRVNHYKFDYNALLPWERQLKATVFPFYTYTRKAIPALMEQMFINPHYFQMANRFMMNNDGSAADAFNYMNMPQWIRDFGFGTLTDETNPLAITGEILPTNVLDIISSNSLKEAAGDLLSTANPFIQAPIEQAMGRTLFDGRPIEGGAFDYAMSKIPFIGDMQERFSNLPGVPGESANPYFGGEGGFDWTKLLSDRALGLGMGIHRVSEGQQEQQMETNFDKFIEQPLIDYNRSQDRYTINMDENGQFIVRDKINDQDLQGFPTPQQAIEYAASLPTVNFPRVPSLHQPTGDDLARMTEALYQ
jgi:hypothetical protein